MLIQCQACATRYRVEPERLPRRKIFVRCKTCGTPIYVDLAAGDGDAAELPTGGPEASAVIVTDSAAMPEATASGIGLAAQGAYVPAAPAEGARAATAPVPHDGVPVQCPQCQSRYRVPAGPLSRPHIKLKCSVCGHIFAPAIAAATVSEERMDALFDDLRPGLGRFAAGASPAGTGLSESAVERLHAAPAGAPFLSGQSLPEHADPELAYLDAVALGDEEGGIPTVRRVPEDQKYRLFLQPDRFGAPPGGASVTAGQAAPPPPPPEAAQAPSEAGAPGGAADEFLDIDIFDDDEAPPRGMPHAAEAAAAPAAEPAQGAAQEHEAPEADEWAVPALREGLKEEPSSEELPGQAGPYLTDMSAGGPHERPKGAAGGSRERPEGTAGGSRERSEGAQSRPAAAGPGEDEISRLESDLETADLPPLDDVDLEALELDAAQAAREESAGTYAFDVAKEDMPGHPSGLGAPDELPPLEEVEPPPAPSAAGAPEEVPPLADLESPPGPSPVGVPIELPPLADLEPPLGPSAPGAVEELPPLADLESALGPSAPEAAEELSPLADLEPPLGPPAPGAVEELPPLADLESPLGPSTPGVAEELPPLADLESPLGPSTPGVAEELPPLADLEAPLEPAAPPATAPGPEVLQFPIVPADEEARRVPPGEEPPREVVPGQAGWFTERRRILASFAIAGVLVGAIIGWAGWLMRGETELPFALEFGKVPPLALQEDLTGRLVANRSGQTLFAVEGTLVNRFPARTRISWVRVRGTLYADREQSRVLGTSYVYLGNVLTQEQLQTWQPSAIAAYGAYNNGRKDVNFEIPAGATVPFQLVFPDIRVPVARTVAQVTSYTRNGLTVYLDAPVKGGQ
ncbi:MAG: zinc-ribbon domain-containing protein [SAR324 cluster bacterium]